MTQAFTDSNGGYYQTEEVGVPLWAIGMMPCAVIVPTAAQLLEQAQAAQLSALATSFSIASTENVTDSNGDTWSGGMSSAVSIYGAVQLASSGGATTVTLFDASNLPHSLTIAKGTAVAAAIGAAYQTVFAKYQAYKVAVAGAKTAEEVQAITWS